MKCFLCPKCEKPMQKIRSYAMYRCTPCNFQYDTWDIAAAPKQVDLPEAPPEYVPWSDAFLLTKKPEGTDG